MKKIIICVLALFVYSDVFAIFGKKEQDKPPVVAIADFVVIRGATLRVVTPDEQSEIQNMFFSRLYNRHRKKLELVTREKYEQFNKEIGFQDSDLKDEKKTAKFGEQTGATWIVRGEIRKREKEKFIINVWFFELNTRKQKGSAEIELNGIDEAYSDKMNTLVDNLVASTDLQAPESKKAEVKQDSGPGPISRAISEYFSWAKNVERNDFPLWILIPKFIVESDGDNKTTFGAEWALHHSFIPFTSMGISFGIIGASNYYPHDKENANHGKYYSWGEFSPDDTNCEDYIRPYAAGTMGLLLPVSKKVSFFADGLIQISGGTDLCDDLKAQGIWNDSGVHFGYSVGISTKLTDPSYSSFYQVGMELMHRGIWIKNKNKDVNDKKNGRMVYSLGLGFFHFF